MVNLRVASVVIGGNTFNKDKSGYPTLPTVYSGVDITWGAPSCSENPDPTRAQLSLWIPKTYESWIPELGDVVTIRGGNVTAGVTADLSLFAGKIESVKLQDDHNPSGGYRINVVAADALAEAARMRLSDTPWPYEGLIERQLRIKAAAVNLGVAFQESTDSNSGYFEAVGTKVIPRDVDSLPALEVFQKTCMAAGRTVISVNNVVRPAYTLKLPTVLNLNMAGVVNTYNWTGTANASTSQKKVSGVVSRTNRATNPSGNTSLTNYSGAGGSGTATLALYSGGAKIGTKYVGASWTDNITGTPAVEYTQTGMTGATSSKVSVSIWAMSNEYQFPTKGFKLVVTLLNGGSTVATYTSSVVNIPVNTWGQLKLENLNATSAFNTVKVSVQPQGPGGGYPFIFTSGQEKVFVDALIIEQAATVGTYFDGGTIDAAAVAYAEETADVTTFDSGDVEDVAFEIDTSKVINEVKVEMHKAIGTGGTPTIEEFNQVFTNETGSKKTTPQTRTISSDLAVLDPYGDLSEPPINSTMVLKGKLLLAAQSIPVWRISEDVAPVLREVPESTYLENLLDEDTRFGALIAITDTPALLPTYMRVHAGRVVIGEINSLELEVEPVDYSAPVPLTANTLIGDSVVSTAVIGNFQTITINDLRTIGAR